MKVLIVLLLLSFLAIILDFPSLIILLCLAEGESSVHLTLTGKSLEVRKQHQMLTLLMTALTPIGNPLAVCHHGLEKVP